MSLTLDDNLCNIMRTYNIFQKFRNKFLLAKYINNFKINCFNINREIINIIQNVKKLSYLLKFKEEFKYNKFIKKNSLKKYILKFKNNFYKENSNAIKILFDYFVMFNNINLDIYSTKIQTKKIINIFLWENCIDYKNFNLEYNKDKYYFKDIIYILVHDNKLQNYIIHNYKTANDILIDDENPIFLYMNELSKFNNNETTLCICGNLMEIKEINNCYDNNTVCCDFTGMNIIEDKIFHCNNKSNIEHPFGFDISINISDKYLEDMLKRKLEKYLYFLKNKYENKINNNINNEKLRIYSNKYINVKKIYDKLCEELIEKSIIYYKTNTRDLTDLSLYYLKYRLNLIIRLYNIKRILETKKNWYELCVDKYKLIYNYYVNLTNFIISLKPIPNMFENITTKTEIIKTYRNTFKSIEEKINFDIKELDTLNLISYDINLKDCFVELNSLILILDTKFYNYYEAIEILENCSTNDNIIEFIDCESLNNDICIVCQEDIEINLVKIKKCGHIFHKECIVEWLTRNNSCPTCRISNN